MNNEEIDYWLRLFSNNNQSFMSKDGKKITLFKVFQELKELHYLLKIKNDYIKELEAYKYDMDRDYLRLEKENKILRENAEHNDKVVDKVNWENLKLKEQVDYLRRSIERKEETIIDLQNERVPYVNEYVAKLENH